MGVIAYFDSGTTNSRIYLLDEAYRPVYSAKVGAGSKDCAISGDRGVLVGILYDLYRDALSACGLTDSDVVAIYGSGMISSAYGLCELVHAELPISVAAYAQRFHPFMEETRFGRELLLAPGMKKLDTDFDYVNNMRGEEMEVIGMLAGVTRDFPGKTCAIALPGSHTHIVFVRDGELLGILSNFTGELFHAVASETVLSPVLKADVGPLEEDWIRKGVENLRKFGMSRALYICHGMRVFSEGSPAQRLSYGEGVLLGGVAQSLEYYIDRLYPDCDTLLIAADGAIARIYSVIFSTCPQLRHIEIRTAQQELPYPLLGLIRILQTSENAVQE